MQLSNLIRVAAATAAMAALAPLAPAAALADDEQAVAVASPCHVSLFGTVKGVNPRFFTLDTLRSGIRNIHVETAGARMNTNGLTLRRGVFAGVYGCFAPQQRFFKASEVTLASSPESYTGYARRAVTTTGTIVKVQSGQIQIHNEDYGYLWVFTSQSGFTVGQNVTVTGSFNPVQSSLNATSITVAGGPVARTVTLTGSVVKVESGRIQILAPRYGHLWVYTSQTGFAPGQRVSVTGTLDAQQTRLNATTIAVVR